MTLGELNNMLSTLHKAEQRVVEAERSVGHGGNSDTMFKKYEILEWAQKAVESLRNEEITT